MLDLLRFVAWGLILAAIAGGGFVVLARTYAREPAWHRGAIYLVLFGALWAMSDLGFWGAPGFPAWQWPLCAGFGVVMLRWGWSVESGWRRARRPTSARRRSSLDDPQAQRVLRESSLDT